MKRTRPGQHHDPVLVVGLGDTGLSVVRHLHGRGESVQVMDSRDAPPGLVALREDFPDVQVSLGEFNTSILSRASRVVLSPGVALAEPAIATAVNAGVEVIGDVELFAREAPAPVVAITGSNGKSTVTALLGDIIREAGVDARVGGNLAPPALDLLSDPVPGLYVLELSSFQLETTWSLAPRVAMLLNVSADHLDRYSDLAAYISAKERIFSGAEIAVVNLDDTHVMGLRPDSPRVLGFSMTGHPGAHGHLSRRDGQDWLMLGDRAVMRADAVPLPGRHNVANVLAAITAADALELPLEAMIRAIEAFKGLSHRCALVTEYRGVHSINDSKGTNVGATVAAINGLAVQRNVVLIAGGLGKGQDFSPLASALGRHVHTLVLLGRDAGAIEAIAPGDIKHLRARDMDEAVALAGDAAREGDTVLLSPACASFDQFASYSQRGDAFVRAVQARCAS